MLDTVRLGVHLEVPGGSRHLLGRGWTQRKTTPPGEASPSYSCSLEVEGVRLYWQAGIAWLSAEMSLPKLMLGDNAKLLTDWATCRQGLDLIREIMGSATGAQLPPLADMRMSRADPVWAWPCDPAPYLAALSTARVPYCQTVVYEGGVRWVTAGKRVRGRCYDKAVEQREAVDLPMRLERQIAKPNRTRVYLSDGSRLAPEVAAWDGTVAVDLLCQYMRQLGLDRPVRTSLAILTALEGIYPDRPARNLYRALLEAREWGGWDRMSQSRSAVRRSQRRLAAAGVHGLALDACLPPLALPG